MTRDVLRDDTMEAPMKRILVWDIPTRLFHWLFAGSFLVAFAIANLVDDDSSAFKLHMWLGGIMAFMVVLRVIWGLVGSRWSRFGSFAFGPAAVLEYVKGTLSGAGKHYVGHNPGSSLAIFALLALALGLAITGASMSTGGEVVEELHEILAFAMMAVVGMHVAGVVLHTLRHKENITASMLSGHKQGAAEDGIASAHAVVGLVFLSLTGAWAYQLFANYDAANNQVTLPVIGKTISLGEDEGEAGGEGEHDEH